MHGQLVGLDAGGVEPVQDGAQFALAAVVGDLEGERLVVAGGVGEGGGGGAVGGGKRLKAQVFGSSTPRPATKRP